MILINLIMIMTQIAIKGSKSDSRKLRKLIKRKIIIRMRAIGKEEWRC
jgi:hypothetical protein